MYGLRVSGPPPAEDQLHYFYAATTLPSQAVSHTRTAPSEAVLARMAQVRFKLQNEAFARAERSNAAVFQVNPDQREFLQRSVYGTDENENVLRKPHMRDVKVHTVKRPEGTYHVVPLNMNDDPADRGDVTMHTLVFDAEGRLVKQHDGKFFTGVVADVDGDGLDEMVSESGVYPFNKGEIRWPPPVDVEAEVCQT